MKKIILLFLLLGSGARGEMNYSLDAGYRSVPRGYDVSATAAYDGLLWGTPDREKPLYGFYRTGVTLGGTPTAAAFLQVAPVAPLVIEIAKSASYRYVRSSTFDCDQFYCYGVTDRTDIKASLAAAYGNLIGLFSYLWRDVRAPASSNPVVAELEYLTVPAGATYNYGEAKAIAGYKLDEARVVALMYTSAEISYRNLRSDSLYLIFRWNQWGADFNAGAGVYNSDQPGVGGNSLIFSVTKTFGESLSLF